MSEAFKDNRVTVRHLEDGRTQCVNRTKQPFTVSLLDGTEVTVNPGMEFVGTADLRVFTPVGQPE